nr:class I SAM-dependent methyltransferase [Mammaliicoccus sp. Marseille-Q6498]
MNIVTNVRLTTAVKSNASLYKQVEDAFHMLKEIDYINKVTRINRKKLTINQLFKEDTSPLIVFESTGPKLYFSPNTPIYFHQDTAKVKLNMLKENKQPILIQMIDTIMKENSRFNFVDGTMGFGRDSYLILKSYPDATVFAIEQNPLIHFVISEGMKKELTEQELKRIYFINANYNEWIKAHHELVEILYLDHMFEKTLNEFDRMGELSRNIDTPYNVEPIQHYQYLILKAHYKSPLFKQLNVTQCMRKNAKTHYGMGIQKQR